jgi:hypothetical protein
MPRKVLIADCLDSLRCDGLPSVRGRSVVNRRVGLCRPPRARCSACTPTADALLRPMRDGCRSMINNSNAKEEEQEKKL